MIYFDNSATTKINDDALKSYQKVSETYWGNPSSLHKFGEESFSLLNQSRKQIADLFNVNSDEIFFTSGGTEGDNWIIKGVALNKKKFGNHIITSSIEHPAVMNSLHQLEDNGFEVTYLPVDEDGRVSVDSLKEAINENTILVSIMGINNEIGAVQPIDEISNLLSHYPKIDFHVDAVQTVGKGDINFFLNENVNYATFSGHKFHGPRGVGFVYIQRGKRLDPLIAGGGQEKNQRSGTENVPAIVAMSKALRITLDNYDVKIQGQKSIKEMILNHIQNFDKVVPFSKDNDNFAPHILCFAIKGVRGETIVHAFEQYDIYISTTSACSSKKQQISGTLKSMNIEDDIATSAVRISLDEDNTKDEAKKFLEIFDILYKKFDKLS
ncbi:aminotransferase class V-fold PLP-dependent enzyme [Lactobacillus sp. S2-2]|uniref:cysteine desulfurase family protein n=1 Tax=Lactobacillus sp. S2-2 TaxID=2692917 RepID=UPI001F29397A|nr:cysteine desulfurase family protein [Lactobacillus sp. S2-2]MCF6515786.1 aminotransferase class V-fold PLP-dependent enzyme [Lactobacillus sp. S2-2]